MLLFVWGHIVFCQVCPGEAGSFFLKGPGFWGSERSNLAVQFFFYGRSQALGVGLSGAACPSLFTVPLVGGYGRSLIGAFASLGSLFAIFFWVLGQGLPAPGSPLPPLSPGLDLPAVWAVLRPCGPVSPGRPFYTRHLPVRGSLFFLL